MKLQLKAFRSVNAGFLLSKSIVEETSRVMLMYRMIEATQTVLLSKKQKYQLLNFILKRTGAAEPLDCHIEQTLGYIMSSVDVRRTEHILDESIRELVRCTFEVLKNDYLLENGLITASIHQESISKTQARIMDGFPELGARYRPAEQDHIGVNSSYRLS